MYIQIISLGEQNVTLTVMGQDLDETNRLKSPNLENNNLSLICTITLSTTDIVLGIKCLNCL